MRKEEKRLSGVEKMLIIAALLMPVLGGLYLVISSEEVGPDYPI